MRELFEALGFMVVLYLGVNVPGDVYSFILSKTDVGYLLFISIIPFCFSIVLILGLFWSLRVYVNQSSTFLCHKSLIVFLGGFLCIFDGFYMVAVSMAGDGFVHGLPEMVFSPLGEISALYSGWGLLFFGSMLLVFAVFIRIFYRS